MPLPAPQNGETQSGFVTRCMHAIANDKTFKSQKQKIAVCEAQWARNTNKREK
jgi:hypothetical protein